MAIITIPFRLARVMIGNNDRSRIVVKLTVLSLIFMSHARATEVLTWNQCVKETTDNNPDLKAAILSIEAARYQIKATKSNYYPQLSANLNSSLSNTTTSTSVTTTGGTTSTGTIIGGNTGSPTQFYSASLSATENLFSGLQTKASVSQSEASEKVSEANLQSVRAKVSFDLVSAYMNLLYSQNNVALTEDIIKRREENLKIVQLRFENGNENKGSVLLSQAYFKQAEFDRLQAQNAVSVAWRRLAQVMGRDQDSEVKVSGEIPYSEPDPKINLKELAALTPDHLQAVGQESAAQFAVTLARAPFFPSLNLVGSAGQTGPSFFPNNNNSWSVGLNLSFPFFSGGKDYYGTQAAAETFHAASFNRQSIDRGLLAKLELAFTAYYESVEKLKVDQSFLDASTVREKIGRSKYNNGLLTFEDWDIIENDLITRQKTFLQSQRDRVVNEATWNQTQGKGVI